jgi:hypothetical protein
MASELELPEYADQMDRVMALYFQSVPITQIAKRTGLKRAEVMRYVDDFKYYAKNSGALTDRAAEAVFTADEHFSQVIARAHGIADRAEFDDEKKIEISALTLAANTEANRVKMLKDSGAMENLELAKQMADTDAKAEAIISLLVKVTEAHPETKTMIMTNLSKITGKAFAVQTYDTLGDGKNVTQ